MQVGTKSKAEGVPFDRDHLRIRIIRNLLISNNSTNFLSPYSLPSYQIPKCFWYAFSTAFYENAAECPALWTGMNAAVSKNAIGRTFLSGSCIFAETRKSRLSVKPRPVGEVLHSPGMSHMDSHLKATLTCCPSLIWRLR
jgi:hypothetical protein